MDSVSIWTGAILSNKNFTISRKGLLGCLGLPSFLVISFCGVETKPQTETTSTALVKTLFYCKMKQYGTYHANFGLLTRAGRAHKSLQLLSDLLVLLKNLSELLHKVLRLAWVWQVSFNTKMERCFPLSERFLLLHKRQRVLDRRIILTALQRRQHDLLVITMTFENTALL